MKLRELIFILKFMKSLKKVKSVSGNSLTQGWSNQSSISPPQTGETVLSSLSQNDHDGTVQVIIHQE